MRHLYTHYELNDTIWKTIIWPWGQRSRYHEGHYGTRYTAYVQAPTYQISLTYLKRQKYYSKINYLSLRSKSQERHYGMRHTALWPCTHIPNIIDLSGQKSYGPDKLRWEAKAEEENQTKTIYISLRSKGRHN